MSQAGHRDIERGNDPLDGVGDHPRSTQGSTSNQPSQGQIGQSNFGDSSGPLFSIYCKAAKDEDNKTVERWQKDADGILIFTGLFSAAVAALLAVTVQDLRPSSQDTSAFYLGNIYEVLADPNATRASVPSPVAQPPPFSPPRYAIWVNSLWFLSLVISLTCALLATSLHQWSRRYLRVAQLARRSPENQARMRAFFAEGVDKMHIPWAVEVLPTLLHLSVFLFFGGLSIFLFNVHHAVFGSVIWWIGLFLIVYGLITVMPILRHNSPYHAPLSQLAWFLYAGMSYVVFKVLASASRRSGAFVSWLRFSSRKGRYYGWMLGGVKKAAAEAVEERSSEVDIRIFDWTIGVLGDDDSLEKFFEAVPGFFSSKLVKHLERDFPEGILNRFWSAMNGFMNRTLSSNSVIGSVKARRAIICRDIINIIPCPSSSRYDTLSDFFDQAPVSLDRLEALAQWRNHKDDYVADCARVRVAKGLASMQERDDDWITFASNMCGLEARDLRDNIAHSGDNVLLATLIAVSRRAIHFHDWRIVGTLTQFDIRHTLPGLQHDFCTLWNELVQEARNRGHHTTPVHILRWIRHLYIALHQGTDAAPTAFSASTDNFDRILSQPSSYPLCIIADHRRGPTTHVPVAISGAVPLPTQPGDLPYAPPHQSTLGGSTALRLAEETNIITALPPPSPPDRTTASEIGETSQPEQPHVSTFPVRSSSFSSDRSPQGGVATAQLDITSAATLSQPLESIKQDVLATLGAASPADFSEVSSTVPTPVPVPESTQTTLNKSSAIYDASPAFIPKSLLPASSGGFFAPDSPLPPHVPPFPNEEPLSLLSGTSPKGPSNVTLPHLHPRRLVHSGNMHLANAVLQLLVCCPPFGDLFRDPGRLVGRREGETDGGATPLIDATVRFLDEFAYKETSSPTHQFLQQAPRGKAKEDEDGKKEDDGADLFPTYVYDVVKEKRQFITMSDDQQQDATVFFGHYLDALDDELVTLRSSISTHKPASIPKAEGLEEETQLGEGQTEVGERDYMASSVRSPISRIFGGKSRLTIRAPNQPDTVSAEDWRSLQLNIQPDSVHTIQDSLLLISQPQPLPVCQSNSIEASQRLQIETLPPVLVLHLKRFLSDGTADGIIKIRNPVQFAPELEIPLEIMTPGSEVSEPAHYKLCGVLYHHGESPGSGHYTVDVLNPKGDNGGGEAWLRIDEVVNAMQHEEVFGGHDNEQPDDRCAYMLFYCRTDPIQTQWPI